MNILTVGFALPNPAVDNYTVLTAPSYSDYEAVVVDPAGITDSVQQLLSGEKEFRAMDDRPIINGATTATAVSAAEQVMRRADETRRLLEAGGVVIVMCRPNATAPGLVGFEGCDRYSWLPAPAGAAWGPSFLRPSDGVTVRIVADAHPFSMLLRESRREVAYRAIIDEKLLAAAERPTVMARGGSNVVISASFRVLNGLVVFVPHLKLTNATARTRIAKPFVGAINWLIGGPEAERPPSWTNSMAVPGLEQVDAQLDEAETTLASAEETASVIADTQQQLASHRRLLWADGSGFQHAVQEALELFGFTPSNRPEEALAMKSEDTQVFIETESTTDQVKEWPYIRLQRRLEEKLLSLGSEPRGLIVVNGRRGKNPSQRTRPYTDALKNACDNYGYTLITGETMFALVQRALGGAEDSDLTGIRRRLASHPGLLDADAALGEAEAEQEQDAGPIF